MMVRVVKIDNVNNPKPGLQKRNVVVSNGVARTLFHENVIVSKLTGLIPNSTHNLGSLRNESSAPA